jgi:hypothetical protein
MADWRLSTPGKIQKEIKFPFSSNPLIDPYKQDAVNNDQERKAQRK